ncbi:hypothetical protein [Prauserella muralis]|uniref:NADPH-dependent reductive aminase-like C-terminal domain-containing protein n=1 Tax=Prauserella muralis TaxID=588067 RepID=A0A2V4ALG0_9PSEU|nr:hypothetical protein BAY60_25280 [Prauserella muralis]
MWNILNGFLHGAALLGAARISASAFLPFATRAVETVSGWLPGYARQMDDGTYPALDATVGTHLAAMRNLVTESEASAWARSCRGSPGAPSPTGTAARATLR